MKFADYKKTLHLSALYTSRLICLGAFVWAALIVADVADSMAGSGRDIESSPAPVNGNIELPNFDFDLSAGYWSWGADSKFSIRRALVDDSDLESRLQAFHEIDDLASDSRFDAHSLVQLAKTCGAKSLDHPGGSLWVYDDDRIRLRMVIDDANSKRPSLVAAIFATRNHQDWHLTSLRPASNQSKFLLPFSDNATTICSRHSPNGELQVQLVATAESGDQLMKRWLAAGWQIEDTPWNSHEANSHVCVRDRQAIYVWSENRSGIRNIMLTSVNNMETKP